jgi:hypothetical protein
MERTEDQKRRESVALFRRALIGDLVHEHQGLYARLRASGSGLRDPIFKAATGRGGDASGLASAVPKGWI